MGRLDGNRISASGRDLAGCALGVVRSGRRAEDRAAVDALRRSAQLRARPLARVASLVGLGAVLALGAGPLIGALLILVTNAPLPLLNVVAGVIYTIAIPFVAVTTTYVYMDARTRAELEPADELDELPAEIQLSG